MLSSCEYSTDDRESWLATLTKWISLDIIINYIFKILSISLNKIRKEKKLDYKNMIKKLKFQQQQQQQKFSF